MKKVKWSPVLILFPFIIALHTLWQAYVRVWTAFSFYIIIGFIVMMLIVLLLDRFFVMCVSAKTAWAIEIVLLLLALLLFLYKCT